MSENVIIFLTFWRKQGKFFFGCWFFSNTRIKFEPSFPKYYMVTVTLAYQFCQIPHLVFAVLYLSSTMVDFLTNRKKKKLNKPIKMTVAAKSLQSCPTLCNPTDGSPPGSAVPGILQARTLEWVAISFSNVWEWKVKVKLLSRVRLFTTPWTAAHQAPPSMGFSSQEYWSGVPLSSLICQ